MSEVAEIIGGWLGEAGAAEIGGSTLEAIAGTAVVGAITGAVIGAAAAAVTGGDIGKGALKGAMIGGVTAGVFESFTGNIAGRTADLGDLATAEQVPGTAPTGVQSADYVGAEADYLPEATPAPKVAASLGPADGGVVRPSRWSPEFKANLVGGFLTGAGKVGAAMIEESSAKELAEDTEERRKARITANQPGKVPANEFTIRWNDVQSSIDRYAQESQAPIQKREGLLNRGVA